MPKHHQIAKDTALSVIEDCLWTTEKAKTVHCDCFLQRQDARIIVGVFYEDMARRVFCQVSVLLAAAYFQGDTDSRYGWIWYTAFLLN